MSQRWITTLLSLLIVPLLFTACKKQYSSDNPLPTSYYPSIIIYSDNQVVYGVDPVRGVKNWEFSMPSLGGVPNSAFAPSPLLYNGMVYLTAINSDTIYKINSKTGAFVKKLLVPGYPIFRVIATPIADGNLIYLATTNDTLYAMDTGTGAVKWKFGTGSSLESSPTIYNGNIYIASTGISGATGGHVFCLNKTTGPDAAGNPIWDYPGNGVTSTASFISSPAISAPFLYLGSTTDSNLYSIYLTPPPLTPMYTGALRWTFKTGDAIRSSPTAFAGLCIVGSNDFFVYCVDTLTSTARWKFRTSSRINSSPIINNQTVYIGSDDYYLYALNIINGSQKWSFKTSGLLKSSPLPYNGYVYIGSYDGNLYAVDSSQGTLKWKYYINGNIESSPVIDNLEGVQINSQVSGFVN